MIQKSRMLRQLDSIDDEPKRKTYGRSPPIQSMRKSNDLPTNMVFWMEETQDVFPLNQNGASQFLKKMNVPAVPENIDWVIDSLLNTPIQESIDLNGYSISISCECNRDPGNRTLSQLGIVKSMIVKPINRPPSMMQKSMSFEQSNEEQDVILGQLQGGPTCPSGVLYGGQGILFGKPTMDVYKLKKSQYTKESQRIKGAEVSSILQKGRM